MFGHIHGSGGMNETLKWNDDSETICYNVSVMNEKYQLTNPVTVIEL
jgi:hypothetical protein